jgi:Protein of unknown function (DUF3014)
MRRPRHSRTERARFDAVRAWNRRRVAGVSKTIDTSEHSYQASKNHGELERVSTTMKSSDWVWGVSGVVVCAAAAAILYFELRPAPQRPAPPPAAATPMPQPAPAPTPPPAPPAPAAEPAEPLPALDQSDETASSALVELLGQSAVQRFLVPEQIVRRIVVTIDNLPREKLPLQTRPINPTPGQFVTTGGEDAPVLAAENFARYRPFIALVDSIDADAMVALYARFYPLLDEAYQSLGNADGSFDARLRAVIDHLLAAPEPNGPIRLARPNVLYVYADPDLEARSAGQKLLIRIGRENELVVKGKLAEVRDALPSLP